MSATATIIEIPDRLRENQKFWIEGFAFPIVGKVVEMRFPNDEEGATVIIQPRGGGQDIVVRFDKIAAYGQKIAA